MGKRLQILLHEAELSALQGVTGPDPPSWTLDRWSAKRSGKEIKCPRSRPPYPPEFRAEAVRLVRSSGEPIPKIARELGVSPQTLRNWVFQAGVDAGEPKGS